MLESLDTLAPFAIPLAVIVGLLIGSFLNVVIYRVPVMMDAVGLSLQKSICNLN